MQAVTILSDAVVLQEELDGLYEWSNKQVVQFIIDKGSVLSVGKNNPEGTAPWITVLGHSLRERRGCACAHLRTGDSCVIARNGAHAGTYFQRR